jgi:hypothetical protein
MNKNEVKKFLYKNKEETATFNRYQDGKLYYNIRLENGVKYEFPIYVTEYVFLDSDDDDENKIHTLTLSSDLGNTPFHSEIKASLLIRWIDKAMDNEEFVPLSGFPDTIVNVTV